LAAGSYSSTAYIRRHTQPPEMMVCAHDVMINLNIHSRLDGSAAVISNGITAYRQP
jgi:hypothetical protein